MNLDPLKAVLRRTPVEFRAGPHTYHLDGRELASVGSVVQRFEPEFDLEYWSEYKAKQRGITAREVQEEWAAKAQAACDKGHKIHEHIQAMLMGPGATCDLPEARAFDKWWRKAGQNLEPVACEVILHGAALGIAGTTDLVAWSRKTRMLHVLDWKTNAKFEKENKYGDFMLPPFQRVPSCQHGAYSVQVGIYRRLARQITGAQFGDSWIIHMLGDKLTPHRALELDAELAQALDAEPATA